MNLILYVRNLKEIYQDLYKKIVDQLISHGFNLFIPQSCLADSKIPKIISKQLLYIENIKDSLSSIDYFICLGGDGTILQSICLVKDSKIPIIGINFGRLGFLAPFLPSDIEELIVHLKTNKPIIEKRKILQLITEKKLFAENNFALNECVILKNDPTSTITIRSFINGEFLTSFWADGVIISTPTGSTGYNLSCNGPIIFPETHSLILTPISPHNLNTRPLVLPQHYTLSFEVESKVDTFICCLDSRKEIIPISTKISIKQGEFTISLVRSNSSSFLQTIKSKLHWGYDKRN